MSSKKIIGLMVSAVLLGSTGSALGANCFKARMTGDQVVDGTSESLRKGRAKVKFNRKLSRAKFRYAIGKVDGDAALDALHLHCGEAGTNGDLLVNLPLDKLKNRKRKTIVRGRFNAEHIENDAICNEADIVSLEDLAEAMEDGDVYTHTHPQDETEIRGQLDTECN